MYLYATVDFSVVLTMCLLPSSETFIRNVLRNVGKHNVDVASLSAADLDQLAGLIADALQVVEQQAEKGYAPRDLQGEDQPEDLQPGDLHPEDLKPEGQEYREQDHTPEADSEDQSTLEISRQQNEETLPVDQRLKASTSVAGKTHTGSQVSDTDRIQSPQKSACYIANPCMILKAQLLYIFSPSYASIFRGTMQNFRSCWLEIFDNMFLLILQKLYMEYCSPGTNYKSMLLSNIQSINKLKYSDTLTY